MNLPASSCRRTRLARAFTLMEMVVVLAIIALLMGAGVYMMTDVRDDAKYQMAITGINSLKTNLIRYETFSRRLPTTEQGLQALVSRPESEPRPRNWKPMLESPDGLLDPWNNPYQYLNPGKRNTDGYDLFSYGPDKKSGTEDDIGNW